MPASKQQARCDFQKDRSDKEVGSAETQLTDGMVEAPAKKSLVVTN